MSTNALGLNVLTLNVHKGFSFFNRKFILPELRDAVRDAHVDVVFLQEVIGAHAQHALDFDDWPALPQYEFLADTIWSDFAYGKNAVYPHGHHGNAVLSKYPIVHHENRDVSFGAHEKRGLLHCVLDVPRQGGNVHVICVHLGLREAHRRQQLELLAHMIDKDVPADAPLIVAGDFNDWRLRGHPLLIKNAAMREVFVDAGGRPARTFPARWPFLRLDRIYVRNATVVKPRVLSARPWSHLSDHAALMTEVMI